MKQAKKLTRRHKEVLSAHHMKADEWSLVRESEFYLYVVHKITGQRRTVDKYRRKENQHGIS